MSSFHVAPGVCGSTQIKSVIFRMESHGQLYGPIETKYSDVGPSIPIWETTFGDAQYRLG